MKPWQIFIFATFLGSLSAFAVDKLEDETPKKITCITCDSDSAENCVDPKSVETKCESTTGCYTVADKDRVVRGCIGDEEIKDPKDCNENSDDCVPCSDENDCNKQVIPKEKCYFGQFAKGNVPEMNSTHSIECPRAPKLLGCYHLIGDKTVEKGCFNQLTDRRKNACKTNDNCLTCEGDHCNNQDDSLLCYACNGKTDPNCELSKGTNANVICPNNAACLVGIDVNGYTHRGCDLGAQENVGNFSRGFQICHEKLCNGGIFPEFRFKCYQCENSEGCDKLTSEDHQNLDAQVCKIHAEPFDCFSYLSEDDKVHRGCLNDKSNTVKLCLENPLRCEVCVGSDCNTHEKTTLNQPPTTSTTESTSTTTSTTSKPPSGDGAMNLSSVSILIGSLLAFFINFQIFV